MRCACSLASARVSDDMDEPSSEARLKLIWNLAFMPLLAMPPPLPVGPVLGRKPDPLPRDPNAG